MTARGEAAGAPGTAAAWVEHLRHGGTTAWGCWRGASTTDDGPSPGDPDPGSAPRPLVPGAQQLELLRILNTLRPGAPVSGLPADPALADPALADRVLAASGLGRGLADLPLLGGPRSRFGPPAVDPERLPVEELLRVAVLMVADDLAERAERAGPPGAVADTPPVAGPARRQPRRWLPRPRGNGWELAGGALLVERLCAELAARGRTPGGRHARAHVLAGPLDRLLVEEWAARCLLEAPPPWSRWLDAVAGRSLPPGADVASTAAAQARRVGTRRVVVVTDPGLLPGLLGEPDLPRPAPLVPEAADLVRRVGEALGVVVAPHRRPALLREHLLPRLWEHQQPGPALALPVRHLAWARRAAQRQARRIDQAGYAVAGDVDDLLPGRLDDTAPEDRPAEPDATRVLALAGRIILAGAGRVGADEVGADQLGSGGGS